MDEESGTRRLNERLGSIMRSHGAKKNLHLRYVTMEGFDLKDHSDTQKLKNVVSQSDAKIILVDAFADFTSGDENTVKDVLPVFSKFRSIAEKTQSAIVIIHHAGKSGNYRGSSSIKGAVDLLLEIKSKPDSPKIYFKSEKARDAEPFSFAAAANFGDDTFCLTPLTMKDGEIALSKTEEYVLGVIRKHGNTTVNKVKETTEEYTRELIRKTVNSLVKYKIVERKDGGGKGTEATYGLTADEIMKDIE